MMSTRSGRPAWVVPTLLVAAFAVAYLIVRMADIDRGQLPFATQRVPAPTASPAAETPVRTDYGLTLTATGLGPHRFGDGDEAVVDALTALLGTPTADEPEECAGASARWVRWADLSIRLASGRFVAFIDGIHYPPGPPPLAIPTAEGLAPGDPASRLFDLYDRASLNEIPAPGPSEQEVTQFEITDGSQPLVVVVEGPLDSGIIAAILAGSLCPTPG
jgi:hypothetical protein